MTAEKQKAIELINKFKKTIEQNDMHCALGSEQDFALICVDEIIKCIHTYKRANSVFDKEFWQSVRNEIINYK